MHTLDVDNHGMKRRSPLCPAEPGRVTKETTDILTLDADHCITLHENNIKQHDYPCVETLVRVSLQNRERLQAIKQRALLTEQQKQKEQTKLRYWQDTRRKETKFEKCRNPLQALQRAQVDGR